MKIIFASLLWWCWSYWEAQRKVNIKVQKDLARKKKEETNDNTDNNKD